MDGELKRGNPFSFAEALLKSDSLDTYRTSIAYYMLTGRKGSRIYTDGNAYLVIAEHPHIDDRLLVFPEINGGGTLTIKVLSDLEVPVGGIQLARYTEEDLSNLQQATSVIPTHKEIELIESDELVMDWKYPVHILNTSLTGELVGKNFHQTRTKFNRVSDRLTILPLDAADAIKAMRAAVMFWAGAMIYADKESGHSLTDFYDVLIKMIECKPHLFDGFVTMDGEEPAGFTVWDKPINGTANAIAGLSRRSIKGMSEFQTVTACRLLAAKGVKGYNLGGSETESLDRHKRQYMPTKSVKVRSLNVYVQSRLAKGLSHFELPGMSV